MNKVILMGRLVDDPKKTYSAKDPSMAIVRYTLAVDRRVAKKTEGQQTADFPGLVAFGKSAEFAEKYFRKGMRVLVEARIQTGSYKDNEGKTIYTTNFVVDSQEFADGKSSGGNVNVTSKEDSPMDGFVNTTEGIDDEDIPFGE